MVENSVPEKALHETFGRVQDGFLTAFDEALARLSVKVKQAAGEAAAREEPWLERMRAGLVALLGFLDDEPHWGGLLVADAPLVGAPAALERANGLLGVLRGLVGGGPRGDSAPAEGAPAPEVMAELVAGGVFAVIEARIRARDGRPFVDLAPSLMSLIAAPFLGEEAARAELVGKSMPARGTPERQAGLPIRATYRTARVLRAIAISPHASNRQIARDAGLSDEGQTSKLLRRLARQGLIENVGLGAAYGKPNAWLLTRSGRRIAQLSGYGASPDPTVSAGTSARGRRDV